MTTTTTPKKTPTRIYVVTHAPSTAHAPRKRLVEASTAAQAIHHAVGTDYTATVATQNELVELVLGDTVVERAGAEPAAT